MIAISMGRRLTKLELTKNYICKGMESAFGESIEETALTSTPKN